MPIDLEYLLSASNHGFFHYSSFDPTHYPDSPYGRSLSFSPNHCVPRSPVKHQDLFHRKAGNGGFASSASYNLKDNVDIRRDLYAARKKKVSFADDRGFKLVEVREIPGAPKWADDVLTLLIGSAKRTVVKEKKWKVAFEYPPWPDDKLIDTLERNMVALEHVSVKEGTEDFLTGTIKVKNLAFEKSVFLRVTFDRWLSYVDIPCTYMKPNKESKGTNVYDTFYFSTNILPVASRYEVIEFCICFQCDGKEYWDNNCGINYRLIAEYVRSNVPDLHQAHTPTVSKNESFSDVTENAEEIFRRNNLVNGYPSW